MEPNQYPSLFQVMDTAAVRDERAHFRVLRAEVLLLCATAAIASVAWSRASVLSALGAIATAVVLILILGLGLLRQARRYDRRWFACRSVSESAKTETWRFMTRAKPYASADDSAAEKAFLGQIRSILENAAPEAKSAVAFSVPTTPQVTSYMRSLRGKPLNDRLKSYLEERVRDQRAWYAAKAAQNARREARWFLLTLCLQVFAAAMAVWVVTVPNPLANPVGLLTTIAASGGTWSNARGYRELAQSYGMVSQELGVLEDEATQITDANGFEIWVDKVEHTISREHTMWVRRRTF